MKRRSPLLTVLLLIGMLGGADAAFAQSLNDAYTFSRTSIGLTSTETIVAELQVAPGSYIVNAYALIDNLGGVSASIICTIASGGVFDSVAGRAEGAFDSGVLVLQPFVSGTNISSGTLSLTSVAELPSGGRISMMCGNDNGSTVSTGVEVNIVRLTAMRVASLTEQ